MRKDIGTQPNISVGILDFLTLIRNHNLADTKPEFRLQKKTVILDLLLSDDLTVTTVILHNTKHNRKAWLD
jgi:hypothetical protein